MTLADRVEWRSNSSGGSSVLALADFSSLAPRVRTVADVVDALVLTRDLLVRVIVPERTPAEVVDVDLRIYGGFLAHDGTATDQYSFLLRSLRHVRGLSDGVRVTAQPVIDLACRPGARILGTYRSGRQRMVDQMLAQDARFLGPKYDVVSILADDEDYFPAILAMASEGEVEVRWLRQREVGRNDHHLSGTNVVTLKDPSW